MSQVLLGIIALALVWTALRPYRPAPAEAGRETVAVDLERVGGRLLVGGVIPIRCETSRP